MGGTSAADAVIRAVVAHENFPLGNSWRASDASLQGIANCGFPDFLRRSGIDGNQEAVASADIDFSIPDTHAPIIARRARAKQCLIEPDLGIVLPEQSSRRS